MAEIFVYVITAVFIVCGLILVTLRNKLLTATRKRDLLFPWGSFFGILFKFKIDNSNSNSEIVRLAKIYNKFVTALYALIVVTVLFLIIGNIVQAYF